MSQKEQILRGKMPVGMLQEMCMKSSNPLPVYHFAGEEVSPLGPNVKTFTHIASAMGKQANGVGRSKQESKHEAAWQLIRELLNLPADESDDLVAAAEDRNSLAAVEMGIDRVTQLREICLQRNFKLPEFELVRNYGPSHAPVFEYEVRITNIVRRGTHSTKKGAKQIACQEMIKTLQAMAVDDSCLQLQSLDAVIEQEEQTSDQVIRSYREYAQSDNKKKLGVSLADRHLFFLELPSESIAEAHRIMENPVDSHQEKCHLIPKALGLKYKITLNNPNVATKRCSAMHSFELQNPDYDCYLFGAGDAFFTEVFNYFCIMLNFNQVS